MKRKTTLFILSFCCAISVFGQKSKFLFDASENPTVQKHIEEVNRKRADTTYRFSAIPVTPIDVQEREFAPQHFPYPVIFIHGLVGSADTWAEFYTYALNQNWSYGGQIISNLNSDENFGFTNLYSASQIDILKFTK